MDIAEFLEKHPPAKRKGKLSAFKRQIRELSSLGYSAPGIQEWLKLQGVEVTARAITKSLKQGSATKKKTVPKPELAEPSAEGQSLQADGKPLNGFKSTGSKTKAEREAFASQFIKDNPIPPTVKRLNEKKKNET